MKRDKGQTKKKKGGVEGGRGRGREIRKHIRKIR